MTRLSARERAVLDVLSDAGRGEWVDGPSIARAVRAHPQGAHQTVSSLVRKGLARKARRDHATVVVQITDAGRATIGGVR